MYEFDAPTIVLSLLMTWTIGLTPPLVIRYVLLRRPISTWAAIGTCGAFWVINILIFTALGSKSKTHGALVLVALVSYWILRGIRIGSKQKEHLGPSPSEAHTPEIVDLQHINTMSQQSPTPAPVTQSDPIPISIGSEAIVVNEEKIYATIAQELESGLTDKGLWTRLFAESGGDDKQTKVLYIKQRAARLITAEQSRLEHAARERAAESARVEKIRLQGLSLREKLVEGNITKEFSDQIHALSNSQTAVTIWHKVRTDRFDDVDALLDEDPRLVAVTNSDGDTLLHAAVYERSPRMIQLLLERGAPPDAKNIYGVTPISYASKAGEEKLVELLTAFASYQSVAPAPR